MSILNVWVTPEAVTVFVDTATTPNGIALAHASKLIPLVHSNIVLAGQGHLLFLYSVFTHMQFLHAADFDELLHALPELLKLVFEKHREFWLSRWPDDHLSLVTQSVVVAGWSPTTRGMRAWVFLQTDDGGFIGEEIARCYYAPADAAIQPPRHPSNRAEVLKLANLQVGLYNALEDRYAIAGGHLVMAEVTRDNLWVLQGDELDPPTSLGKAANITDFPTLTREEHNEHA